MRRSFAELSSHRFNASYSKTAEKESIEQSVMKGHKETGTFNQTLWRGGRAWSCK